MADCHAGVNGLPRKYIGLDGEPCESGEIPTSDEVSNELQGYFDIKTAFHSGGSETDTVIEVEDTNAWVDLDVLVDQTTDSRPKSMVDANVTALAYDSSTKLFTFEGLESSSFCIFNADMSINTDEDDGEVSVRLLFNHHSGITPTTSTLEDIAGSFAQGADEDYVIQPTLIFPINESLDTSGIGDAGKCKVQLRSTVPCTVSMRGLTWFLYK